LTGSGSGSGVQLRDDLDGSVWRDVADVRVLRERRDAAQLDGRHERGNNGEVLAGAAAERAILLDDDPDDAGGVRLRQRLQQRVDLQGRVQ
jgi:hypothetical protein